MKSSGDKRGMTLIEVIISLAILGILAATFFGAFTSGFSGIISAGKYSKTGYDAQQYMENRIAGLPVTGIPGVTASSANTTVTIDFGSQVVTVNGKLEQVISDDGKHQVDLSVFIPN